MARTRKTARMQPGTRRPTRMEPRRTITGRLIDSDEEDDSPVFQAIKEAQWSPSRPRQEPRKQVKKFRKKARRFDKFHTYVHRVLKQVHPDTKIKSKAMEIMNSFVNDLFERITSEASRLVRYGKTQTLSSRDIQTAVRLILPGELSKHAIAEGTKAMKKYASKT